MSTCIGIFVFPDVEVLDFAGPYEVFTTTARMFKRSEPLLPELFTVFTVAEQTAPVRARAGLIIQPDYVFANHPRIDVLLVPGGIIETEIESPTVVTWIGSTSVKAQITASICTGSFLLAQAGLLNNRTATSHWEDIADMRAKFPSTKIVENRRWVDEGSIVTSAGISAGIDMSLHLVERLASRELALRAAHQMDFDWHQNA